MKTEIELQELADNLLEVSDQISGVLTDSDLSKTRHHCVMLPALAQTVLKDSSVSCAAKALACLFAPPGRHHFKPQPGISLAEETFTRIFPQIPQVPEDVLW
jgi:hypothetical protein